ncbi:4-hydroxyphenylacetate 3-hydroxylase N-terminal domain-containing protein [Pseudomonas aeruginosa]|nr:4-hydroxyphenylacetate 3-hydroxylase N-terminal domain-containing protein [Pseudomonas aeruginosa]
MAPRLRRPRAVPQPRDHQSAAGPQQGDPRDARRVRPRRTRDRPGIVVSGAKMLATGSAITNATFVAPVASAQMEAGKAEDFAWCSSPAWTTPACA